MTLSVSTPLNMSVKMPFTGIKITITAAIALGHITATVNSEDRIEDFLSVRNYVSNAVQQALDVAGFLNNCWFDLDLSTMIRDEEPPLVFTTNIQSAPKDSQLSFQDLIGLWDGSPHGLQLGLALMNLRLAMKYPWDTALFCYRALESMRQFFSSAGGSEAQSWNEFNTALSISKRWSDDMRLNHATPQRHGTSTAMTGEERIEMISRVTRVIERFVIYKKRGQNPLDSAEFPLLT